MDLVDKYLSEDTKKEIAKLKKELATLRKGGKLNPQGKKREEKLIADLVRLGDFSEI
jgi:hypothetical protein